MWNLISEHRILMEIAYVYHGRYKFAITTETQALQQLR